MNPPASHGVWQPPGVRRARLALLVLAAVAAAHEAAFVLRPSLPAPPLHAEWPLALAVLAGERLRLPLQNVVALAVLSAAGGVAALFAQATPNPPLTAAAAAAALAVVALPGARCVARWTHQRLVPPRGWSLPLLTALLAALAWESGRHAWLRGVLPHSPARAALALPACLAAQFALTPWWVDKRRVAVEPDPLSTLPWLACFALGLLHALAR